CRSSSLGSSGWSDARNGHPPPAAASRSLEPRLSTASLLHFRPVPAFSGQGHCPGRANSVDHDWLREYTQAWTLLSDRLLDALRSRALGVVGARFEGTEPSAPLDHRLAADRARLVQDLRALPRLAVLAHVRAVVAVRVA